jgi:hypothetical protein
MGDNQNEYKNEVSPNVDQQTLVCYLHISVSPITILGGYNAIIFTLTLPCK